MQMFFYAGCNCVFLFNSWSTNEDQCGSFAGFLALTLVYTLLTDFILASKNEVRKTATKPKSSIRLVLVSIVLHAVWCLNNVMLMLLAMSYNWYVILTIGFAKMLGYYLFTSHLKSKRAC